MKKSLILFNVLALIMTLYVQPAYADENLCPDDHHPHMIDLGLPSGIKWACCNLDASSPEEYGGYYAWGETKVKETYTLETYEFRLKNAAINVFHIGDEIDCTLFDAAYVNSGKKIRCRQMVSILK